MTPVVFVAMALAGGLGAGARFVLDGVIRSRVVSRYPVGTLTVNVTGSFLLGFITGLALSATLPAGAELIIGTGFLGGYTTFSTASVETVRLLQERRYGAAMITGGGMLGGSLLASAAGLLIGGL